MLSKMLVPVSSATSSALVETGEQRSPKKLPERTAPPSHSGSAPMERPTVMQMAPMVAAVPKEVPVSMETPQFKRNVITTMVSGRMASTA